MNTPQNHKKQQPTYPGLLEHPSGIEDEGELAFVSAEFWLKFHDRLDPTWSKTDEAFNSLLYFQQGWKACKDFYGINT